MDTVKILIIVVLIIICFSAFYSYNSIEEAKASLPAANATALDTASKLNLAIGVVSLVAAMFIGFSLYNEYNGGSKGRTNLEQVRNPYSGLHGLRDKSSLGYRFGFKGK